MIAWLITLVAVGFLCWMVHRDATVLHTEQDRSMAARREAQDYRIALGKIESPALVKARKEEIARSALNGDRQEY